MDHMINYCVHPPLSLVYVKQCHGDLSLVTVEERVYNACVLAEVGGFCVVTRDS